MAKLYGSIFPLLGVKVSHMHRQNSSCHFGSLLTRLIYFDVISDLGMSSTIEAYSDMFIENEPMCPTYQFEFYQGKDPFMSMINHLGIMY